MTTSDEPVLLEARQTDCAGDVLARAFQDDLWMSHIFPDADERRGSLPWFYRGVVRHCRVYGEVYTTPNVEGVACWLSPGKAKFTVWRVIRSGMALVMMRLRRGQRRRFMDATAPLDVEHQRLMPGAHWYLLALGVEPASQGQGIGSKLIEPVLRRSDAEGLPCYLETPSERNIAFHERRGFTVASELGIPGGSVKMWTMARPPRR